MEAEDGEFQDWEVLHHINDAELEPLIGDVAEVEESSDFVHYSGGMIEINYFSLDSRKKHIVSDDSQVSAKTSDNPSWIDPGFETRYHRKHSAESWSESSSDQFDDKKLIEFEEKVDVGFVQNDQNGKFHDGVGGVEHMNGDHYKNSNTDCYDDKKLIEYKGTLDVGFVQNDKNGNFRKGVDELMRAENDKNPDNILADCSGISYDEMVVEDVRGSDILSMKEDGTLGEEKGETEVSKVEEKRKNPNNFLADCSGISYDEMVVEGVRGSDELSMKEDGTLGEENGERAASEEKGETEVSKVEGKRKKNGTVWWKLPIELLRYCVFKGPVWTVSIAAAFMGFVMLGRRLYKMKKKSRALAPRMDDKKISQFVSRAARLNEAFSVVKRVPVIRPSLPSGGVTPWPVLSLR